VFVVRRERARSPLDRFSQYVGGESVGPSVGSSLRSLNEPKVLVEPVLPKEVVELSRCDSFVLTDSSVLELTFSEWSNLWNLGRWRQAPCTSLHLLIASRGVSRVSLMMAYRSFEHSLQALVPKVCRQESGSPCQRISILILTKSLTFFLIVPSGTSAAKCEANESELLSLMNRFLTSCT